MDRMAVRAQYIRTYQALATQLGDLPTALAWYRIDVGHADGVSAEDAAAWANAGYLPGDAAPYIIAGITPQMAAEADEALGGSVLERIALLADAGIDTTGVDLTALDD
jgi:hypothetical protein